MSSQDTSHSESAAQQSKNIHSAYASFKHNAALALLVGAPLLIAIPPRKLDLYTFSLAGAFMVSANHLTREKTGRSILQQMGHQYVRTASPGIEPRTKMLEYNVGDNTTERANQVWTTSQMGSSGWKERRLKEEQEKLDQGEGYADMIVDQIWDVWNQKKDGDDEKK